MNQRLWDILHNREQNYLLPFYWQLGNHYETIPAEVERIYKSGARAFCIESRPHPDFCGEVWWRDVGLILSEAKKRGMKVWILDDDHFPTGHANGQMINHPDKRKWQLLESHVDVAGPLTQAMLRMEPTSCDHVLLGVFAYPRTEAEETCAMQPVDLTEGAKGSFLHFSLPKGVWRIFFLYKSRKGSKRADYIDLLSPESVRVLIDAVYEPHYEHFAPYFGNTLAGFFSDEPQLMNEFAGPHSLEWGMYNMRLGMPGLAQSWNDCLLTQMTEALGQDALPLLPALWFDMGALTPKVRLAYMDAMTRRYRESFCGQLGRWCEAHGVEYIGHVIEDMNAHARTGRSNGHYFRALEAQHMSGIDIVLHQLIPGLSQNIHTASAFGNRADPAFFHYVLTKLASSLAHICPQMKGRAMCEMFGAYGWAEGTPVMKWLTDHLLVRGVNQFVPHAFSPSFPNPDCPPHFGANDVDPQFEGFTALMNYTNKAAHLLSGGIHQADAAILYHAEAEWMNAHGDAMLTQVPAKTLYDAHIDYDILPADCFLPDADSRLLPAQADNGRLRVGEETYGCLIVPFAVHLPEALEKALSGLECAGVPVIRMSRNQTAEELLSAVLACLEPDIQVEGDHPLLRCCHYLNNSTHVYMFVNESITDAVETAITLAGAGNEDAVMLDLLNDETTRVSLADGKLALSLSPYQSVLLIRDEEAARTLAPKTEWISAGKADLTFTIETAPYTNMAVFTPYAQAHADQLPVITAPNALPEFSGCMRYRSSFEHNGETGLALDLGEVGQTAHLFLNGQDMGVRICPPYRFDLSSALRQGANELVIDISNTLSNAVDDRFSHYMAIPASGLMGPVRWLAAREENA